MRQPTTTFIYILLLSIFQLSPFKASASSRLRIRRSLIKNLNEVAELQRSDRPNDAAVVHQIVEGHFDAPGTSPGTKDPQEIHPADSIENAMKEESLGKGVGAEFAEVKKNGFKNDLFPGPHPQSNGQSLIHLYFNIMNNLPLKQNAGMKAMWTLLNLAHIEPTSEASKYGKDLATKLVEFLKEYRSTASNAGKKLESSYPALMNFFENFYRAELSTLPEARFPELINPSELPSSSRQLFQGVDGSGIGRNEELIDLSEELKEFKQNNPEIVHREAWIFSDAVLASPRCDDPMICVQYWLPFVKDMKTEKGVEALGAPLAEELFNKLVDLADKKTNGRLINTSPDAASIFLRKTFGTYFDENSILEEKRISLLQAIHKNLNTLNKPDVTLGLKYYDKNPFDHFPGLKNVDDFKEARKLCFMNEALGLSAEIDVYLFETLKVLV
ncbi:uncharacterized protein MELLADRAFT_67338 [Melampsora larici-populina 98AG31]|uniref:Secreted protein n=1 Tax=Melampsora larici-populina (strain 98AG31 / pathotype 3-4-7) TaxID=747676 RepID=F4S2R3_MELLP|nr:uncharacterized protein MELLADRAFT_67338 [Melampsora larici-populina 98AG31]EGG01043.1 hypothetical protein MELLADRAFT_67338 [Melampsora larici-populina 98AG31]